MADEATTVETAASADAATEGQTSNSDTAQAQNPNLDANTDNQEAAKPRIFTQDEVTKLIARETAKAKTAAAKELADKAAEAEMTEAQKATDRAEKAEKELAAVQRERLLDRVAAKHQLPEALRDRLRGDDEEALMADAEELAKLLKPAKAAPPASESQRGGGSDFLMSDDEEAQFAANMGIRNYRPAVAK